MWFDEIIKEAKNSLFIYKLSDTDREKIRSLVDMLNLSHSGVSYYNRFRDVDVLWLSISNCYGNDLLISSDGIYTFDSHANGKARLIRINNLDEKINEILHSVDNGRCLMCEKERLQGYV